MDRRCPDCGVAMESISLRAGGHEPNVYTGKKREGWLGKLGVDEAAEVETVACPECGLIRNYLQE